MDRPETRLQQFRFAAWAGTVALCGFVFLLSSPLWDGHFHPLIALMGAVVVATVISIRERGNDLKEAPFREASAAVNRLRKQATREEITPATCREACREIVEKAPAEYRSKLRRIAFADDLVQELLACREDYEAALQYYEGLLADLVEASFTRGCSTADLQKRARGKIAHCQERIRYINEQLNDLAAGSTPRDADR